MTPDLTALTLAALWQDVPFTLFPVPKNLAPSTRLLERQKPNLAP